ncbi:hypothetical protein BSL82_08440 [Tardibacter chloracetimidivorans]|uniref:DUF5681 domain-containing protein n=1 Tax=Tardibacter chloracetimidivorans TaxID=1921510 RepID=A0A1L3ZUM9_9SPHN|nr:DUF5681 domain-containing protein [Tardibacter chloracetimidivorans]API59335.1 hypothetical protein BSL82_08440 [Tardibacter chloracetimidivorans]
MAGKRKRNADYEVGYGKPPRSGQFKPGQSGNPSGKRRGKHLATLIDDELAVAVNVPDGDKTIKLSKAELMVKTLVNTAVKGDLRAIDMLIRLIGDGAESEAGGMEAVDPATVIAYLQRALAQGGGQ